MARTLIALVRFDHYGSIPPYVLALLICLSFAVWPSYHPRPLPALGALAQTVIGAAPEYSASPVELGNLQSRWEVFQTQTLPVEAILQDAESGIHELMSPPVGNMAPLALPGDAESLGPVSETPAGGSGALLKFRKSAHPSVFFPFAIRQPVNAQRPSVRRPTAAKIKSTSNAQQNRPIHTLADAGIVLHGAIGGAISGTTIGRRVPGVGILGGGTPEAAKIAASINGATFRPTF